MKLSKKFISTAAAAALVSTAVISVPPTYAAEAVKVETVVIDVNGVKVVVDLATYGEIVLGTSDDAKLSAFLFNGQTTPNVIALQLGNKFVDITAYGEEFMIAGGDIEAAAAATPAIEYTDFKTVTFDENGEPEFTPVPPLEEPGANLTAYNAALAAVTEAAYTPESWTAYQEVVDANVVTAENTQDEVDAATAAIIAAQASLVEAVEVLKVESVSAINATTVNVTFDGDVTGNATALEKTNYTIDNNLTVKSAKLLEDKKTVQLTTDTQVVGKTYTLKYGEASKTFVASDVPTVVETSPLQNNLSNLVASSYQQVTVTFNKALDATTVNSSTVKIFNVTDGVFVSSAQTNGVTFNPTFNRIEFNAASNQIKDNKRYLVTVDSSVKALDGATLGQEYSFEFATGSFAIGEELVAFPSNVTKIATNTIITSRFQRGLWEADVTSENIQLFEIDAEQTGYSKRVGTPVATTVSYDKTTGTLTVDPQEDLKQNTKYALFYKGALRNGLGNYLSKNDKEGLTASAGYFKTVDALAGKVLKTVVQSTEASTVPTELKGTLYNAKASTSLVLTLDKEDVVKDNTKVTITDNNVALVGETATFGTVSAKDKTIELNLTGLREGHSYTVTIDGLVDADGNEFAKTVYTVVAGQGLSLGALKASTVKENATIFLGYSENNETTIDSFVKVDANSVDASKFVLKEAESGTVVETSVYWDSEENKVAIKPKSLLKSNAQYVLTVDKGSLSESNGNKSLKAAPYTITTQDNVGPVVKSVKATVNGQIVDLANGGTLEAPVESLEVEFDEAIHGITLGTTVKLENLTSGSTKDIALASVSSFANGDKKLVITFNNAGADTLKLLKGNSYRLTLTSDLKDFATNPLQKQFDVAAGSNYTLTFNAKADETAPTVDTAKALLAGGSKEIELANATNIEPSSTATIKLKDKDVELDLNGDTFADTAVQLTSTTPVRLLDKSTGQYVDNAAVTYTVTDGVANADSISVVLPSTEGKYQLQLVGVKDTSKNTMQQTNYDFIVGAGPTLSSTNLNGIATDADLVLNFNEALAASTINGTNIKLYKGADTTGEAVTATIKVDATDAKKVIIVPAAKLDSKSSYTVAIGTGLTDAKGNKFQPVVGQDPKADTITFKTADETAPAISGTPVVDETAKTLTVTFDEALTALPTATVTPKVGGAGIAGTVTWADGTGTDKTKVKVAVGGLTAGTNYQLALAGVTDGNKTAETLTYDFLTTKAWGTVDEAVPTGTVSFAGIIADVKGNVTASIIDNVDVDESTINTNTVKLYELSGAAGSIVGVVETTVTAIAGAAKTDAVSVIIDPKTDLKNGTYYQVVVDGVKDSSGNKLAKITQEAQTAAVATGVSSWVTSPSQGNPGTEVAKFTVGATTAADNVTLTTTNPAVTRTLALAAGTAGETATAIAGNLNGNVAGYAVTADGADVVFTASTAGDKTDLGFTLSDVDLAGATIALVNTVQGNDSNINEEYSLTVTGTATTSAKYKLAFGEPTATVTIDVTSGDDADAIAGKINTALTLTGYNKSLTSNVITLTSTDFVNKTDMTLAQDNVNTGVTVGAAQRSFTGQVTESHKGNFTGATGTGVITVTVNGTAYSVNVTASMTNIQVATAVAAKIANTDTNWTVTNNFDGTLTFTSKTANSDVTDLSFTAN